MQHAAAAAAARFGYRNFVSLRALTIRRNEYNWSLAAVGGSVRDCDSANHPNRIVLKLFSYYIVITPIPTAIHCPRRVYGV